MLILSKSRLTDILLTLGKLRLMVILQIWPYSKTPIGKTGCLSKFLGYLSMLPAVHPGFSEGLHQLWPLPNYFRLPNFLDCSGIHFFYSPAPLSNYSQLGRLWLPSPHCAVPVWLTRHHAMPVVTRWFLPNPYLGKQRVSLGVASILSIYLCSQLLIN